MAAASLPENLLLREVSRADVPSAALLEAASYPPDEAASLAQLEFRCEKAPAFFRGLYDSASNELIGFVVGTCSCATDGHLEHDSMSSHDESGTGVLTLMIHSVVIHEPRRRAGLGRAMLTCYLQQLAMSSTAPASRVSRVLLITKAANLPLYLACGFAFVSRSSVVHGKEPWYELRFDLGEARRRLATAARDVRAEPIVQVDAFSSSSFAGNPAAVVFTQRDGDAAWMLAVAAENNLAETAFVAPLASAEAGRVGASGVESSEGKGSAEGGAVDYSIRWFTPACEVDLCGHATIAAAHALWEGGRVAAGTPICFRTLRAGSLVTSRLADGYIRIELGSARLQPLSAFLATAPAASHRAADGQAGRRAELPADAEVCAHGAGGAGGGGGQQWEQELAGLLGALGLEQPVRPRAHGEAVVGPPAAPDLLVLLSRAEWAQAESAAPDLAFLKEALPRLGLRGLVPTVQGDGCAGTAGAARSRLYAALTRGGSAPPPIDFTSRFFAPAIGIDEDPVTGSAHALLASFWAARSGAPAGTQMLGYQASARGGLVRVREAGAVVQIEGEATTVIRGELLA